MDARIEVDISMLQYSLKKAGEALPGIIRVAVQAGGFLLEGGIKENIILYDFIDTGATLNSVSTRDSSGLDPDSVQVEVGPTTEYAIFGELGLGGQSPKPFMADTVEQRENVIKSVVADKLIEGLQSLGE